ncbi:hypothetical protein VUR80DRAFT_7868 [Thermomyces stellatus]
MLSVGLSIPDPGQIYGSLYGLASAARNRHNALSYPLLRCLFPERIRHAIRRFCLPRRCVKRQTQSVLDSVINLNAHHLFERGPRACPGLAPCDGGNARRDGPHSEMARSQVLGT